MYKVDEIGEKKVFIFTFNNINYEFEYDENLFHNGTLYFCEEHKTLE